MRKLSNDRSIINKEVKKRYEVFFASIFILINDCVFFATHFTKFINKIFLNHIYNKSNYKLVAYFLRVLIER